MTAFVIYIEYDVAALRIFDNLYFPSTQYRLAAGQYRVVDVRR